MLKLIPIAACCAAIGAAALAGCGGSSGSSASAPGSSASTPAPARSTTPSGALSGEATAAATGDIPDNQVFLTFKDPKVGFAMRYPEGWSHQATGSRVTFRDKNNIVRVDLAKGPAPTVASVRSELARLRAADPSLRAQAPRAVTVAGTPMVKVTYTTRSAPNSVTGKRVTLMVDRYVLAKGGRVATVDLGTPKGVDNVDAYRMMIESFRWA